MSVVSTDVEPIGRRLRRRRSGAQQPDAVSGLQERAIAVDNDHPEKTIEGLFGANGWGDMWRNGVYDYLHYHATVHEALGVARGHARVRFGGDRGQEFEIAAGDVAILPAGTGHQCMSARAAIFAWSAPIRRARRCTSRGRRRRIIERR